MAISKQQSMRPAEIELIDATNQHESTLQAHAQSLETLNKSLTAETTARDSADTALGTRIDNEVQARTDADTELGTRIDNETQARTDADTALGTRIDNEVQARTDADTALGTRIDNEVRARTDADTALGTRIDEVIDSVSQSDWTDASAGIYASRVGHIVILTLWTGGDVTLTVGKNSLTTLPSGWRPSRPVASTATAKDLFQFVIDTDGSAFIWSDYNDTRSGSLRGNLVYCVA